MPGAGVPSLLHRYLADPSRGTQPDEALADGRAMVEPPRPCGPVGQSAPLRGGPPNQSSNIRKHKEFSQILKAAQGVGDQTNEPNESVDATRRNRHLQGREIGAEEDPRLALAPGAEPGMARASYDPIEWLSFINPGGVDAVALAEAGPRAAAPPSLEPSELVEKWVRRVALGGDARRGVAKLDIGQGQYEGAELLVVAEAGRIAVQLSLPGAVAEGGLADRVRSRLERRGYTAEVVVLTPPR